MSRNTPEKSGVFGFSTDILKPRRGHLQPVFEPECMEGSSDDEHCEVPAHEAHRARAGQTVTAPGGKAGQRSRLVERPLGHDGPVVALPEMDRDPRLRMATHADDVLLGHARRIRGDEVLASLRRVGRPDLFRVVLQAERIVEV